MFHETDAIKYLQIQAGITKNFKTFKDELIIVCITFFPLNIGRKQEFRLGLFPASIMFYLQNAERYFVLRSYQTAINYSHTAYKISQKQRRN